MNLLKKASQKLNYFFGSLLYASYAPKALLYSYYRDWLEKQYDHLPKQEFYGEPGSLISAEATAQGASFAFEYAELEVLFLTADLVRITWKPGLEPVPYAIARKDWEPISTQLDKTEQGWLIATQSHSPERIQVLVTSEGGVQILNNAGQILRQEQPPSRQGEGWRSSFPLQPEECIYGLGERAAHLNLRRPLEASATDSTYRMWNYDAAGKYGPGSDPMYISIPIYLGLHSQGSYLTFYENSFDATFTLNQETTSTATFSGGSLRYYVIGGDPAHLLDRYTQLTGRPALPPRWALGYHQSRWGYRTEANIRDVVKCFKQYELPLTAIHLDIDCEVGKRAFTIDPDRFPNLPAFTRELAQQDIRFITILNPGIKYSRRDKLCLEGRALGAFCSLPNGEPILGPVWPGWCAFPDFTNPQVRRWWSRQYEYLLDLGVSGFWHDMNEPAIFILWGDRSLPPRATHHFMEGRHGDHREAHNLYGMLQSRAAYESLCHYRPHERPFIVSRAGWAGLQRYAWTWTGDIESTWAALRQTVATVVGLGLSGIPYSGPDIGGFQGNPSGELYLRWFQMSTFLTFCRTHSSNNVDHRNPWSYGEPTLSIIRDFLNLRYRLLPYFYTLSWQAHQNGVPPVRPLFWADPQDQRLWEIEDAFLLGDGLLVCPIVEADQRSRSVVLPAGTWYNFWTDEAISGGSTIELAALLEQIPLLVKAGTLLPLEQDGQLILRLYPPEEGESTGYLYSDAGDGYGAWRLDQFSLKRQGDRIELAWTQQGEYTFPYQSIQIQVQGLELQQAWIEGVEASCQANSVNTGCFEKAWLKVVPRS